MPNATGTSTGGCGISIAGQSGSSYLTEAKFDDINFEGGSVGLQIGDWIQGVYVSNCSFAGNDYGIRWSGVSGDADLWLAVVNTHCNSGTRGILAYQAEGAQITNTYHLHFGIPSLDGIYAAVELFNMDGGLVSNNNFYCNGSSSTSASEYGVRIIGGNSSVVHGNRINNPKTAGILLDSSVQNTIVSGTLGTGFTAGVPLIQDTTGYSSNQKYGNQLNGVPDLFTDGSNTLAATALNIYGPLQATSLRTTGSPSSYTVQGGYLMWNKTGNGMTDFVNNRGLGGGGFLFIDTDGTTDVTLLTMTRTNAAFTVPLAIGANQVVGPRIAGWGTSTGGVRGAVTGSSTLPQVAAALAQLLTDLKTHGMIGA
jgi:hypothetical protein